MTLLIAAGVAGNATGGYTVRSPCGRRSPSQVLFAYPHLTVEQVADALAYSLEHRDEIDCYVLEQISGAEPEA